MDLMNINNVHDNNNGTTTDYNSVSLSGRSYGGLVLFIISILGVMLPFDLKLKRYNINIAIDFGVSPLICVLIMLATGCTSINDLKSGIIGSSGSSVQPYAILLLFFSMSYICISLDHSGLLGYIAIKSTRKAKSGGQLLFLVYFLACIITLVTSNDIVILTLTPLVCHFSSHYKIDALPYLIAEFFSANVWSSILYISNATNIIVAQSFNCSFIDYSGWMTLPGIFSGFTCYLIIYLLFKNKLPKTMDNNNNKDNFDNDNEIEKIFRDRLAGYFNLFLFIICIILLIATSFIDTPLFEITVPSAACSFIRDVGADIYYYKKKNKANGNSHNSQNNSNNDNNSEFSDNSSENNIISEPNQDNPNNNFDPQVPLLSDDDTRTIKNTKPVRSSCDSNAIMVTEVSVNNINDSQTNNSHNTNNNNHSNNSNSILPNDDNKKTSFYNNIINTFPTTTSVISLLPWKTIPFLFSMFIFVESLDSLGWISRCANLLNTFNTSIVGIVFIVGILSSLICCVISNQPMTILLTRILIHPAFSAPKHIQQAGLFSIILASNNGPNLALSGALAGLLWQGLLMKKSISISYFQFLRYGLIIMPPVIILGSAILVFENYVFYKQVS